MIRRRRKKRNYRFKIILIILFVLICYFSTLIYFWYSPRSNKNNVNSNQNLLNEFAMYFEEIIKMDAIKNNSIIVYSKYFEFDKATIYCLDAGYNKDDSVYLNKCYINDKEIKETYGKKTKPNKIIQFFDNSKELQPSKMHNNYKLYNNNELIEISITDEGKLKYYNYHTKEQRDIWQSDTEQLTGFIMYYKNCTSNISTALLTTDGKVYLTDEDIFNNSNISFKKAIIEEKIEAIETLKDKIPDSCGKVDLYIDIEDVLYTIDESLYLGKKYNELYDYKDVIGRNGDYLYIFDNNEVGYYINLGFDNNQYNYIVDENNNRIQIKNIFMKYSDNETNFYLYTTTNKLYVSNITNHKVGYLGTMLTNVKDYRIKKQDKSYNITFTSDNTTSLVVDDVYIKN